MSRRGKSTPLLSLHDLPAGKKALGQQVKEIKGNSWDDHKVMQFCESHDWDPKNIEDAISAMIENPQEEWKEYSKKKPRKKPEPAPRGRSFSRGKDERGDRPGGDRGGDRSGDKGGNRGKPRGERDGESRRPRANSHRGGGVPKGEAGSGNNKTSSNAGKSNQSQGSTAPKVANTAVLAGAWKTPINIQKAYGKAEPKAAPASGQEALETQVDDEKDSEPTTTDAAVFDVKPSAVETSEPTNTNDEEATEEKQESSSGDGSSDDNADAQAKAAALAVEGAAEAIAGLSSTSASIVIDDLETEFKEKAAVEPAATETVQDIDTAPVTEAVKSTPGVGPPSLISELEAAEDGVTFRMKGFKDLANKPSVQFGFGIPSPSRGPATVSFGMPPVASLPPNAESAQQVNAAPQASAQEAVSSTGFQTTTLSTGTNGAPSNPVAAGEVQAPLQQQPAAVAVPEQPQQSEASFSSFDANTNAEQSMQLQQGANSMGNAGGVPQQAPVGGYSEHLLPGPGANMGADQTPVDDMNIGGYDQYNNPRNGRGGSIRPPLRSGLNQTRGGGYKNMNKHDSSGGVNAPKDAKAMRQKHVPRGGKGGIDGGGYANFQGAGQFGGVAGGKHKQVQASGGVGGRGGGGVYDRYNKQQVPFNNGGHANQQPYMMPNMGYGPMGMYYQQPYMNNYYQQYHQQQYGVGGRGGPQGMPYGYHQGNYGQGMGVGAGFPPGAGYEDYDQQYKYMQYGGAGGTPNEAAYSQSQQLNQGGDDNTGGSQQNNKKPVVNGHNPNPSSNTSSTQPTVNQFNGSTNNNSLPSTSTSSNQVGVSSTSNVSKPVPTNNRQPAQTINTNNGQMNSEEHYQQQPYVHHQQNPAMHSFPQQTPFHPFPQQQMVGMNNLNNQYMGGGGGVPGGRNQRTSSYGNYQQSQ